MEINIRKADKQDMPKVHNLINELAIYEKEPDAVEVTVADLEKDGFKEHPDFTCFVAEVDNEIEGLALVYNRYSTWKGRVIHLEDLIVKESSRGKGLGTILLNEVVKYGKEQNVRRISWEVLDWNEPAIEFYEKKGANVLRGWHVVQLDEKGIKNYIDSI
ncbi:Ribosomal protein S18 acetylase RimI [Flavobacteriaceae bacterium MAR_2010_188]|nr:Ribosomal protein S18 acetylase RimI [Flavobacteriaceae bacterium MAR_2010_188]